MAIQALSSPAGGYSTVPEIIALRKEGLISKKETRAIIAHIYPIIGQLAAAK